jgi:hypothetical protein
MQVKTPEQLEDAAISDAIRSIVGIKIKATQRELVNKISEQIQPKVDRARLDGKRVDIQAFIKEVLSEVSNA